MSVMDGEVLDAICARGVQRLTHFTPSSNLPAIFGAGEIRSAASLVAAGGHHFITDHGRHDGHADLICCNFEYPNAYYFASARSKDHMVNFEDWVVFLIDPSVAARRGTLFAPGNAAVASGGTLASGTDGLQALWAPSVRGRQRAPHHRPASPTDVQAEILIPGAISLSEIQGIVAHDEERAKVEQHRLAYVGEDPSRVLWFTNPDYFSRNDVANAVRGGRELPLAGPFRIDGEEN